MTAPTLALIRGPVEHLDGDGWLVKGDMPEADARRWVFHGLLLQEDGYDDGVYLHEIGVMGAYVRAYDDTYIAVQDWWRKQPCLCGEGHSWDVMSAAGPGKGAFKSWVFTHRAYV